MSRGERIPCMWPLWVRWALGLLAGGLLLGALIGAPLVALRTHPLALTQYGTVAALLITTGKILGLLAAVLVLVQLILAAKLKLLDRIFGLHRVLGLHRILGLALVVLVSFHPLFVFAPRAREIGPLQFGIWPVLVGVLLLIGLWTGALLAMFRLFLGLPYRLWYRLHRAGMWIAVPLLGVHGFVVTGDLNSGWPLMALVVFLLIYILLLVWKLVIKPVVLRIRWYTVTGVRPAGKDTYAVEVTHKKGEGLRYLPGQFAFVAFRSQSLPGETHPWTVSSTPTRPESLIFTIKCSGDFTAYIGRLATGEKAFVDGPFGDFTHRLHAPDPKRKVVMIAGGVGITPMLSMLRYMADREKDRAVVLIWSNRTEEDILCRQELEELRSILSNLVIQHVLTRESEDHPFRGRLELDKLKDLLSDVNRDATVFVCGPPVMMGAVCKNLRKIGFQRRRIQTERFSY